MRQTYLLVLLFKLLTFVVFSMTNDWKRNVILDIATAFDSGCLRILHENSLSPKIKEQHATLVHALLKKSIDNSKFIQIGALSFEQYLISAKHLYDMEESCFRSLQVFHASEATQQDFKYVCQQIRTSDFKWLIFMEDIQNEESFFQDFMLPLDSQIMIAKETSNGYRIQEIYRIQKNTPIIMNQVADWASSSNLQINHTLAFRRRLNLNGAKMRIASIENWPITTYTKPFPNSPILDGFFAQIWYDLGVRMNFTTEVNRSIDNSTGTMLAAGNWSGLFGMIIRNEIDAAVSELNMNIDRMSIVDFPRSLLITNYQVYYRMPGYSLSWTAVFDPLDELLWFAILAWIVIATTIFAFSHKKSISFSKPNDITIQSRNSLFFLVQSLCQQGYSQVPETLACRIIFLICYLFSAILIPCYSASIVSSLTAQSPQRPFDSLEGMLIDGRYKLLLSRSTAEYTLFQKAKDSLYANVYEKLLRPVDHLLYGLTSAVALTIICGNTNRFAVFGVESVFEIKVAKLALEKPECLIAKFSQPMSKVYQGIALAKDHPYTELINFRIHMMYEAGVIKRLSNKFWFTANSKFGTDFKQVQLNEVFQIFGCLIFGVALSLLLLTLEILLTSQKRRGRKRNSILLKHLRAEAELHRHYIEWTS